MEYVVAPYEADAQMAFLARNGHVDLVITEDSDLIAYECPQVEFLYFEFYPVKVDCGGMVLIILTMLFTDFL